MTLEPGWVMLLFDVHVPAWCRVGLHASALQQGRGQASQATVPSARVRQALQPGLEGVSQDRSRTAAGTALLSTPLHLSRMLLLQQGSSTGYWASRR